MNKVNISIIIPTLGRTSLYSLVQSLLNQKIKENYEIILIPQGKLMKLPKDKRIKIYHKKPNMGFAYYRNTGLRHSFGKIVVFIDDDELPRNNMWLSNITNPILSGFECVVTAGVQIPLGKGYLTDSISLLGFPGGGAIGFETMWPLLTDNYTTHLCSGNFAIKSSTLRKVDGFSEYLKSGNEDVELADKLTKIEAKILYVKNATVYHLPRSGILNFIKWNYLRGKSAFEFFKYNENSGKINNRVSSSVRILKKVFKHHRKYLIGVFALMLMQYLSQASGFLMANRRNNE